MNNQNDNVIRPNFNHDSNQVVNSNDTAVTGDGNSNVTNASTNTNTTVTTNPVGQSNKGKKKFNPLVVVIALVVVIVLVGGYTMFFGGSKGKSPLKGNDNKEEKITFDTDYEWANTYGLYIQDYFENIDKFDIAFVDLTNDEVPELVMNYVDKAGEEATDILFIKNGEVSKTRTYNNTRLYLITPVNIEEVLWYLYIGNNTYGKYTIVSQLIDGTALDATIKATNDDEVKKYNSDYVHSNYELIFYEIEKDTFKDDYLTKVQRYEDDTNNINNEIEKLKENRNKYITDNNIDVTQEKVIKLNDYTLEIGEYKGELFSSINGEIESTEDILRITSLNTLYYNNVELTFTVVGNTLSCNDGTIFTVVGNNQLQIMDEDTGPVTYAIPKPEDDKKNSN